jgi:hypothetical protein
MTGTNCDLFTHNQSRSYLNHLVSQNEESLLPSFVTVHWTSLLSGRNIYRKQIMNDYKEETCNTRGGK